MTRENEEQRPGSQTLCGALQKEPNCKCLVLSVLIYGCLAAVTWCRCANVTKVVINFSRYPIKSTRHVSPCDDGYIYIPVAFMGMLYLVYLVECYHSPIRIDLLHSESQDSVLSKILQLKSAQPTIWWKAVSYHYVRRKRQITRYRNGDNYTTTQVYYERINTHAATSFYYYDFCGVKDISKELILDPKVPITKINLSKGFAFSNMRSATEFEEARTRFFAEQELRDDYMEMREGLDLGYNLNATTLVAVLGNPWFTNRYVYWCLSALLLSWPLRVVIEYKTQYADYQITKLFGINYDTPSGSEPIHASMSQQTINQAGSYMLAPSYSEALLMDPAPEQRPVEPQESELSDMVPSYSEALLYQRAEQSCVVNQGVNDSCGNQLLPREYSCPCHMSSSTVLEEGEGPGESLIEASVEVHPVSCPLDGEMSRSECSIEGCSSSSRVPQRQTRVTNRTMSRDVSEPNLRSKTDMLECNTRFLRLNGRSLRNILESELEEESNVGDRVERSKDDCRLSLCSLDAAASKSPLDASRGAIPKRTINRSRVIGNPMSNEPSTLSDSNTYFCLKSILKQNKRRYTLITANELQNLSDKEEEDDDAKRRLENRASYHEGCAPSRASTSTGGGTFSLFSKSKESLQEALNGVTKPLLELDASDSKKDNTRTLIFASPIQEVCPGDPFGGKDLVRTRQEVDCNPAEESSSHAVLTQLGRSLTCDRRSSRRRCQESTRRQRYSDTPHHFSFSCPSDRQHRYPYAFSASTDAVDAIDFDETKFKLSEQSSSPRVYRHGNSFPPYEGTQPGSSRTIVDQASTEDRVSRGKDCEPSSKGESTRSLIERRTRPAIHDPLFRRSFTGRVEDYRTENNKWANLNMETSL